MLPQFVVRNSADGQSIDIMDAERGRQERVMADFSAREPTLSARAQEAIVQQILAEAEMADVRRALAGAVTNNNAPDVLNVLHVRAEAIIAERAAAAKAIAKAPPSAPTQEPKKKN